MKCLLLAPSRYPFIQSIIAGMEANDITVRVADYEDFFRPRTNRLYNNYTALPRRIRRYWEEPYVQEVNQTYRRLFREFRPDLVFIYNNQLIQPDVLEEMRGKAKIAFMLGDNPLYTPTSAYNLHILFSADYIISPDSMWQEQMTRLGIRNVVFDSFGFNSAVYYPMDPGPEKRRQYQSDFIYIGSASKTNWGYKRFLFLNAFRDFDLSAYISGDGSERWLELFPDVAGKIKSHDRFDAGFNNLVYNCSKIAPVELVPSLFKGIHVRVFDILGAGILPFCEYSEDLERVFGGIEAPFIRDYREIPEHAAYWLRETSRREACVQEMRKRVEQRFAPAMVIQRMTQQLFDKR